MMRVLRHWNKLLKEVVHALPLQTFHAPAYSRRVGVDCLKRVPSNPNYPDFTEDSLNAGV